MSAKRVIEASLPDHELHISYPKNILVQILTSSVHSNVKMTSCGSSIKPGTWNIPEHLGTSNNYDNYEKNM